MAATAGHRLTLDHMRKCSNAFFSETTNIIKAKLYMNVHWMVLYNLYVFCSGMKFKMAAMAGLSLTLDPMGKMFQNASSLKPLGQLKPNFPGIHWMVLYKLYVFCSGMKFKMAAMAGLSLTLDPMGKMFQNASSLKPLGQLKPNCPGMIIGRFSTKFVFFMSIGNPRWPPPQYID